MTSYRLTSNDFIDLMTFKRITPIFSLQLLVFLLITLRSSAEIIWEDPKVITGMVTDFNTDGVLLEAKNGGGSGGLVSINTGVEVINFTNSNSLGLSVGNIDPHNRGEDQAYEDLLGTFTYAFQTETISIGGLTVGNKYLVQLWIADTRPNSSNRQKTFDSGAGTDSVTLDSGPPSEYVIGEFIATGTSHPIRFVGGAGADHPQFNAIMVRDLGQPVPKIIKFDASDGSNTSSSGLNVSSGTSVTLSWETEDAISASISSGVGSVATTGNTTVSPTVTTTYTLTATNVAGSITQSLTIYVGATPLPPVLNELVASNKDGLTDMDGEQSDWIELYNPNPYPIDAGDYRLTDDPTLVTTWDIPNGTMIPANGYIVIFASGKNRIVGELHTDFKLSSAGDYVALTNDAGLLIISQVPENYPTPTMYPELGEDVSYGLSSNDEYEYFPVPTPGAENTTASYIGFVADTKFSHDRGFYETAFMLTITSVTPSATIRYTTDGSIPTASNGMTYSGPILIDETTVVRAYASLTDYEPTDVDTHTYLFAADIIAASNMDTDVTQDPTYSGQMVDSLKALPVISINIDDVANLSNSSEKMTSVELINPDGSKGFQYDAGITRFGGYFTNFDKKSYRIYFRKQYGPGKLKHALFDGFSNGRAPTDTFDHLDLRSGSHDMSLRGAYLSNRFTDDSTLEMGHVAPHGRFVHVIRNGVYWGQYHLRERWSASFAEQYLGNDKDSYDAINGNANVGGWSPGEAYDGTDAGWTHIKNLATGANPWADLQARVDIANYIDFMLLYNSGKCENEYRTLLQAIDNGVTSKMYLNDADGYFNTSGIGQNNDAGGPGNIFGELLAEAHPDFMALLSDRIHLHFFNNGAFTPDKTTARLQRRYDETKLSFLSESARWGEHTPTSYNNFQENIINNVFPSLTSDKISDFKNQGWYPALDAPTYNQNGGIVPSGFKVILDAEDSGVIYYTLDGTDPRLEGGGINPNATAINQSGGTTSSLITVGSEWKYLDDGSNQGTAWRATAFDDSGWASGDAELGYGDGDEESTVSFGSDANNKHVTTYFRKSFNVTDASVFTSLSLTIKRDDGAVVYLNGVEVSRSNMPSGSPTYTTLASSAIGGADENAFNQFSIPVSALQTGNNTIAVEIHQTALDSSDISFDLTLTGVESGQASQITLSSDVTINARLYNGGNWSAVNSVDFIISIPPVDPLPANLLVTELHYHPDNPSSAELISIPDVVDGDFEFLELANISASPLRLDGCSFTQGIGYIFPEDSIIQPGERIVIVANAEAFALRHSATSVQGEFTGGLKNSSETVTLVSATSTTLLSFTYSDGTDRGGVDDLFWPTSPDGSGPSLVLINPRTGVDLSDPREWRPSTMNDGNPASNDSIALPVNPGEDADGDGYSALIELTLGSSDADPNLIPAPVLGMATYPDGETYLTITLTRNALIASNVNAQASDDLSGWGTDAILTDRTSNADGTETLRYRHPTPTSAAINRQFLRINASSQ